MLAQEFVQEEVDKTTEILDRYDLRPYANRLVVVGGNVLIVCGIVNPNEDRKRDRDIVSTRGVLSSLGEFNENWNVALGMDHYSGLVTADGEVSIMSTPLPHNPPHVVRANTRSSEELIEKGIQPPGSPYSYLPPEEVRRWKMELVRHHDYPKEKKAKHVRDIILITKYLKQRAGSHC